MTIKKNNKGFTLLETVVYVLIVALLFFIIVNMLLLLIRLHRDSRATRSLQEAGLVIIERMGREIRGATRVEDENGFGTNPGKLKLYHEDENGDEYTVSFSRSPFLEVQVIDPNGVGPLTDADEVTVTDMRFYRSILGSSDLIRIVLTLESGGRTATFYSSAILRGSYGN